ncbi:hypothetical protein EJB05_19405, partial [Eragrostis curvula]
MSKRKSSHEISDRAAKRPLPMQKQHLYLLVDDWERGYSIRKLDVDAFDADGSDSDWLPEHFTEPPVARMEATRTSSHTAPISWPCSPAKPASPYQPSTRITLGLTICPWPSCRGGYTRSPFFVSVGGKLFLFTNVLAEYLGDPPPHGSSKTPWSWTTIKARPPFYTSRIICYALHPDGRTLFVSAGSRPPRSRYYRPPPPFSSEDGQGTFSFDAERLEWTRHGDWLLPFAGQAHFDADLESWVGLCDERDGDGCLCACDVAPVAAAEFTSPPAWKLGDDRLFRRERERLHLGAKLVHMGGDGKFCLVEAMTHEDDARRLDDERGPLPRRRVLRVITFGVKYDKKGELRTTRRRARSYSTEYIGKLALQQYSNFPQENLGLRLVPAQATGHGRRYGTEHPGKLAYRVCASESELL